MVGTLVVDNEEEEEDEEPEKEGRKEGMNAALELIQHRTPRFGT